MRRLIITCCALSWMPINEAHAYIGPGLGLGAVGVVLGLLLSVGLAVLGLFWYPAKRMLRKSRTRSEKDSAPSMNSPDGSDDAP